MTFIFLLNWGLACKNQGYGCGFNYAHICLLGSFGPELVIRSQTLSRIDFVIFDSLNRKNLRFLWNCGLVCKNQGHSCGVMLIVLGPIGPKLIIRSQTSDKIDFVIFDSLNRKTLRFLLNCGLACKNQGYSCGVMLIFVFWPNWPKTSY